MNLSTDLARCYQTLELTPDATEHEIKLAYRHLARRYHPDVNPGDPVAEDRFKQVSQAYRTLLAALRQLPEDAYPEAEQPTATPAAQPPYPTDSSPGESGRVRFYVQNPKRAEPPAPVLSSEDHRLKLRILNQLYGLMKRGKWLQAIGIAESLADRFPSDPDICQWQALAYHRWARSLLERKQYAQARTFLKKALQTDPHNRKLWSEIEQDFKYMERQLKL